MKVGLTMFIVTYLPFAVTGALSEDDEISPLVLPFGGPWLTASIAQPEDWGWALLGSLSGLQLVSAGIFAVGVLLPDDPPPKKTARTWHVHATPVAGPSTWGLSIQGAF